MSLFVLDDFAAALVLSGALGWPVLHALRRAQLVDHPNERSSHDRPTPRGGGIAVAIALLGALVASGTVDTDAAIALTIAVIGFALLGLADDLHTLDPPIRLSLQTLLAAAPLPWLLAGLTGSALWQVVFAVGVWCWIVAYVNACNFMDGINGIAGVQALIAGGTWWIVGEQYDAPLLAIGGAILAGAALGFLPYNFPHARMFLGDVGSYVLGAWMAVLVVVALRADVSPVAALAPVALALADTSAAIVRRAYHREPLFSAHRTHAYQRLVGQGWTHTAATVLVGTFVASCSSLGLLAVDAGTGLEIGLGVAVLAVSAAYLAVPRLLHDARSTGAT